MRYLSRGITREVFLVGRWAVKIPKVRYGWRLFLVGLLANISETEWSGFVDGATPPNPVVWSLPGGWLNVYRRASPFLGDADQVDVSPFGDRKASNLGYVDGCLVVLDFDMSGREVRLSRLRFDSVRKAT